VPAPHAAEVPAEVPITLIGPPSGWQLVNVRELWRYRELLFFLTWRDVKVRYKQTILGAAWAILQPVMMMIVFIFVFSRMARVSSGGVPYPVFVFAGLLPWTFFASAIANGASSVIGSERLITKIYFPRLAIPFAAVGAALVDFAIAFGVLLVLMVWYRIMPGLQILLLPVLVLILTLAALGIGTLLGALTVAYRDFKYVVPFLVQLWLYATPSIYLDVFDHTSSNMQLILMINPMVSVIASFRAAMLGQPIHWDHLIVAAVFSVLAMLAGCLYFRKVEDSFADLI
jgi:lipopolysaccharide transport system permease protein